MDPSEPLHWPFVLSLCQAPAEPLQKQAPNAVHEQLLTELGLAIVTTAV